MLTSGLQPGVKVKVLSPQGKLLDGYVVDRMNVTIKRGGEPVYVICRKRSDGSMLPPAHSSRIVLDEQPVETHVVRPQVSNSDADEISRALDNAHAAAREAAARKAADRAPAFQPARPASARQGPPLRQPQPKAVPDFQGSYPKVAAEASDNALGSSSVVADSAMEVHQQVAVGSAIGQEAAQMDVKHVNPDIYHANTITEAVLDTYGAGELTEAPVDIDPPHDDEQLRRVERSAEDRAANIAAIINNDDVATSTPAAAVNDEAERIELEFAELVRKEAELERKAVELTEVDRKKQERRQHVARLAETIAAQRVDSVPVNAPTQQAELEPISREDATEFLEIEGKIRARRQHIARVAEIIAANRVKSIPAGPVDRSKPQPADPHARRRIIQQRAIQRRQEHLASLAETITTNRVASVSVPKTRDETLKLANPENAGAVLTAVPTPYIDRLAKVCKLWRTESQRCVGGDVRSYGLLQAEFSTVYCFSTINGEISARDRRNLDQALAGNMIGRGVRDISGQTDRLLRRGFVSYRK